MLSASPVLRMGPTGPGSKALTKVVGAVANKVGRTALRMAERAAIAAGTQVAQKAASAAAKGADTKAGADLWASVKEETKQSFLKDMFSGPKPGNDKQSWWSSPQKDPLHHPHGWSSGDKSSWTPSDPFHRGSSDSSWAKNEKGFGIGDPLKRKK